VVETIFSQLPVLNSSVIPHKTNLQMSKLLFQTKTKKLEMEESAA